MRERSDVAVALASGISALEGGCGCYSGPAKLILSKWWRPKCVRSARGTSSLRIQTIGPRGRFWD